MGKFFCILCGVISIFLGIAAKQYIICQTENCQAESSFSKNICTCVKRISKKEWMFLGSVGLGIGAVCYRSLSYELSPVVQIRMILGLLILYVVMIVDYQIQKIPNVLIATGLIGRCVLLMPEWLMKQGDVKMSVLYNLAGGLVFFLVLLLMSMITRNGIGMGDVKLFGMLAFLSGSLLTFCTLVYAAVLAMVTAVVLLLAKKKTAKDSLPFGPFIFIGYVIAIVLGTFSSMAV